MSVSTARRRLISTVAMGAVFLAAQLSSFSHQLLVKHVTCVEHGELIHAGEEAAALPAAAEHSVSASPQQAGHGHDHCDVFVARREQLAVVPSSSFVLEAVRVEPSAPVQRAAGEAVAVPLLRLAPKSSPPA